MNPWESLPLVQHVRELRRLAGPPGACAWMHDEVVFLLYALVKFYKPELVIQTGHLWGKSASVVLDALNDGFLNGESAIEDQPQEADPIFQSFVKVNRPEAISGSRFISMDPNTSRGTAAPLEGRYPNFSFVPLTSAKAFNTLYAYRNKRVLAIIDGDHSEAGVTLDLEESQKLGAGVIFVDDTMWIPHIGRIASEFAARNWYTYLHLPLYNGVGVLSRGAY